MFEKFKEEKELRKEYEQVLKEINGSYEYSFEQFKEQKFRMKNNQEISILLQETIDKIVEENPNLEPELETFKNLNYNAANNGNNHAKEYSVNKEQKGENIVYNFLCTDMSPRKLPKFEAEIEMDREGNIVSINTTYITTLKYEGLPHLAPSEKLEITNINGDVANIKKGTMEEDYFVKSGMIREGETYIPNWQEEFKEISRNIKTM